MQLGRPHDQIAHRHGSPPQWRRYERGQKNTGANGDERGDEYIHPGLLGYGLAQLSGDDGHEQHRQRAARAAQGVGREAHRDQGEEHEGRALQGIAYGCCHGGAAHG